MPKPIVINLDDLTAEKVRQAAAKFGVCSYAAPCIIGTLLPAYDRKGLEGDLIIALVENGRVSMPDDQLEDAHTLQCAFDNCQATAFFSHPRIVALFDKAELAALRERVMENVNAY